jgi:hypothetical protein
MFGMAVLLGPSVLFAQTTEAFDDSAIIPPGSSVPINVVANDIALTLPLQEPRFVSSDLSNGTLNEIPVNGAFTYTANAGLGSTEPDVFVYEVCDSTTPEPSCANATVYVYVGTEITTFDIIPKKLNVKKMGVIPIAIRSTDGFELSDIVPESLMLEGVAPHHFHVGEKKITLKFKAQDIVGPIRNDVNHGDEIVLHLTGRLLDPDTGPVIVGEDTVIIIKKGKQN